MSNYESDHAPLSVSRPSRRDLLALGSLGAAALLLPGCATAQRGEVSAASPRAKRLLRLAHVTDSHTQPERKAFEGTCAMFEHVNAVADKPDVMVHGGDIIFSSFEKTRQRSQTQWDLYLQAMRSHNKIPMYHALGNHDIWGWNKKESETTGNEQGWGKAWAMDLLGLRNRFYAFEQGGTKVIVLDSVQSRGEAGYEGGLDDAQFEWLAGELAATPSATPIVIVTHIPAIHASTMLVDARTNKENNWVTGGGSMLMDRVRVVNLISRHKNVCAVLSGHIHMTERIDYNGTSWINSGAVSGSWWQGQQQSREFFAERRDDKSMLERPDRATPGYGLLDVFADGSIAWKYVEYGWTFEA